MIAWFVGGPWSACLLQDRLSEWPLGGIYLLGKSLQNLTILVQVGVPNFLVISLARNKLSPLSFGGELDVPTSGVI